MKHAAWDSSLSHWTVDYESGPERTPDGVGIQPTVIAPPDGADTEKAFIVQINIDAREMR